MKSKILVKIQKLKQTITKSFLVFRKKDKSTPKRQEETKDISEASQKIHFELSPMNKSTIIQHSPVFLIVKLRNISKSMRRRVKYILKKKQVKVLSFAITTAFVINGWIEHGFWLGLKINREKQKIKGLEDYYIKNQEDFDEILKLNGSVRCNVLENEKPLKPGTIERLQVQVISPEDSFENWIKKCSNLKFQRIYLLLLIRQSPVQIERLLKKVDNISEFTLESSSLGNLNISMVGIRNLIFDKIQFDGPVKLPEHIFCLEIRDCTNFHFIQARNITILKISHKDKPTFKELNWIKNIPSIKEIRLKDSPFDQISSYFPPSLRLFYSNIKVKLDCSLIKKQFPNLRQIICPLNMKQLELLQPKIVRGAPLRDNMLSPVTARPKIVTLTESNYEAITSHFGLLEEVEILEIDLKIFNFIRLPPKVRYIVLARHFQCGNLINRLVHQFEEFEEHLH